MLDGNSHAPQTSTNQIWLTAADIESELARCPRTTVPIDSLRFPTPVRIKGEDTAHVQALAEVQGELPAIVVHRPTMQVIDGMHRLRAAQLRGDTRIDILFFEGDDADAFVLAVRLNTAHGLPLSRVDRDAAAKRIIKAHPTWSDRAIAAVAGLSPKTIASLRRLVHGDPPPVARIGKDGRVRALNLAEARRHVGKLLTERPDASLREVAREAGVSVATARDVRQRLSAGSDPVPPQQRRVEQKAKEEPDGVVQHSNSHHSTIRIPPQCRTPDLDQLERDPSMRFTEVGRNILRLLLAGTLGREQWQHYANAVPVHCLGPVAKAARRCAEAWQGFARQLEKRESESNRPTARDAL